MNFNGAICLLVHFTYLFKQKRIDNSHSDNQKVSSNQMLAASFYTGKGFTDVKNILNLTGHMTQSKASFYRHLPECEQRIEEKANEMTQKAREHFSGNVCIDCRWSSPKRGMHGTVTAVDQESHQVIEFCTLTKDGGHRVDSNYDGSSNNMETVGTTEIIKRLKEHEIFDAIHTITKDRDNSTSKLIKDIGSEDLLTYDPGHYRKSFENALDKFFIDHKTVEYFVNDNKIIVKRPFYGLKERLLKWMNSCLKCSDIDERISMWVGCIAHYLGDDTNCMHPPDEEHKVWLAGIEHPILVDILQKFVDDQIDILTKTSNQFHTQNVESVNSTYARLAPKRVGWNRIKGRIASGVILQNDPIHAPFVKMDCCNVGPYDEAVNDQIRNDAIDLNSKRIISHTDEYRQKKNQTVTIKKNEQ